MTDTIEWRGHGRVPPAREINDLRANDFSRIDDPPASCVSSVELPRDAKRESFAYFRFFPKCEEGFSPLLSGNHPFFRATRLRIFVSLASSKDRWVIGSLSIIGLVIGTAGGMEGNGFRRVLNMAITVIDAAGLKT